MKVKREVKQLRKWFYVHFKTEVHFWVVVFQLFDELNYKRGRSIIVDLNVGTCYFIRQNVSFDDVLINYN